MLSTQRCRGGETQRREVGMLEGGSAFLPCWRGVSGSWGEGLRAEKGGQKDGRGLGWIGGNGIRGGGASRGAVTCTLGGRRRVGVVWEGLGIRGVSGGMRSGDGCFVGDFVRWNVALCGTRSGVGFWCDSWLGTRELGCKQDACTTLLSCRVWQRHWHLEPRNPGFTGRGSGGRLRGRPARGGV